MVNGPWIFQLVGDSSSWAKATPQATIYMKGNKICDYFQLKWPLTLSVWKYDRIKLILGTSPALTEVSEVIKMF